MYRSKYATDLCSNILSLPPFKQSTTKGTNESHLFMMEYQRQNKYEWSNGKIVDDMSGRNDIKSEGDEIKVTDKELSVIVWKRMIWRGSV